MSKTYGGCIKCEKKVSKERNSRWLFDPKQMANEL